MWKSLILCIILIVTGAFVAACSPISEKHNPTVEFLYMPEDVVPPPSPAVMYSFHDFDYVAIGTSTFDDVRAVTLNNMLIVTSYGGFQEYTLNNGTFLHIKYYGPNLIVADKEILETSYKDDHP